MIPNNQNSAESGNVSGEPVVDATPAPDNEQPSYTTYPDQTTNQATKVDDFEDAKNQASQIKEKALRFVEMHGGNHFLLLLASLLLLVVSIKSIQDINDLPKALRGPTNGFGFGVATGLISLLLTVVHIYSEKQQPLSQQVKLGIAVVNAVFWTISLLWLTFDDFFKNTGNGFFSIWVGFFLSMMILSRETAAFTGLLHQLKAFGWQLGLLIVCSIILLIACWSECGKSCSSEELFGVIVGIFSTVLGLFVFYFVDKMTHMVRMGFFGGLCALWVFAAFLLTIGEPFAVTGNGYFASWGGLFASILLLSRVINFTDDNVLQTGGGGNANVV